MAQNDKIYTPDDIVNIILNEVGYSRDLLGKRVLENSCGTGNILVKVVERYINDAKENGYTASEIKSGLEEDVTGLEIDKSARETCKKRLDLVAQKYDISDVRWKILDVDALTYKDNTYSFVLGNPPYITYHDLSKKTRMFLHSNFSTCQKGRFDYCYAFIEQSISNLKEGGRLAYIVPNSILKNVWAKELRILLKPYIQKIIDFKDQNVFQDVTLSPILIVAEKNRNNVSSSVAYECKRDAVHICVDKSVINNDGWAWGNYIGSKEQKFGDYFSVANSVATLLNDAFLIKDYEEIDSEYIKANGSLIEQSVLRPAISIKTSSRVLEPRIIFPYKMTENGWGHYDEDEFQNNFPYAYKYLLMFKERLLNRKADKNAQWFEYGRSQAISRLDCEKLVIPSIISSKVKAKYVTALGVPYAGLYIVRIGSLNLHDALDILSSDDFMQYIKQYGVPTVENSYRISKKIIENYTFPIIKK